jgi:hypothetical protein
MRQQGRIDTWLDDRGFGFITPERGNQRLFVHIKSFRKGGRRSARCVGGCRHRDPGRGYRHHTGALIAQRWLCHKSKKASFQTTFRVTVAVNVAALVWLFLSSAR